MLFGCSYKKTAADLLLLWPPCFHTPDALGYSQQLVAVMQQVVMPNANITEEEEHASRPQYYESHYGHAKTRPTKQLDWVGLGISPQVVKVRIADWSGDGTYTNWVTLPCVSMDAWPIVVCECY